MRDVVRRPEAYDGAELVGVISASRISYGPHTKIQISFVEIANTYSGYVISLVTRVPSGL